MPKRIAASLEIKAKSLTPYTGRSGFYASCPPTPDSIKSIIGLMTNLIDFGIELEDADELHCTTMYSPEAIPRHIILSKNLIDTWVLGADVFGESALVLKLYKSTQLANRFERWVSFGAVSTYPEYKPHITIGRIPEGFDGKEELLAGLNTLLKLYPIPITLGGETIEDVNPD